MASTLDKPRVKSSTTVSTDAQGTTPMTEHTVIRRNTPQRKGLSPYLVLTVFSLLMVALLAFGIGSTVTSTPPAAAPAANNSSASSSSSGGMNMGSGSSQQTQNIPNATQQYGGQPAQFTIDPDGAKHFHFTAKQVMWEVVKGHRVAAYTIDGTVPGPAIRVTANDHVRITLTNHLSQSTSMHWHGLMLPSSVDGVPGVGQKPIQPGQTYTYDFTLHDQDVGTHWYHSHDNDLMQVPGGFYGAFIVDPRPGSPQALAQPKADVEYTEFISEMSNSEGVFYTINGKSFPDTQPILLKHGQTVHIRMIGASEMMHPMHLHGHFFNIVAEDGHPLAQPIQKDTVQVAPGETYDLTFYGWADPGSIYPFHCHILSHVMNPGQTGDEMGGLIILVEYAK